MKPIKERLEARQYKNIDFNEFKEAWESHMVYKPPIDNDYINEMYINYKIYNHPDNVFLFFDSWYEDVTLDTHDFMLKEKAIWNPKYNKGLLEIINRKH